MKNTDVVDIVVLIDRSASMGRMEEETIGAFNAFLKEQKEVEGEALLTLVLFDHEQEVICFREPLHTVEDLTAKSYFVRGNTAMYDCIGAALDTISWANTNGRVIFLIQSDGQENTSTLYNGSLLRRKIRDKEKLGWEFNFVGTGIDAINEGAKFGLRRESCLNTTMDSAGFETYASNISASTRSFRTNK